MSTLAGNVAAALHCGESTAVRPQSLWERGHFVPHKDTPRGSDMLSTLVVACRRSSSNGAFVVKHHGVFQTYDWGEAIRQQTEPVRIHWAAFFGEVDHQIERVWGGLRVTLTHLI